MNEFFCINCKKLGHEIQVCPDKKTKQEVCTHDMSVPCPRKRRFTKQEILDLLPNEDRYDKVGGAFASGWMSYYQVIKDKIEKL